MHSQGIVKLKRLADPVILRTVYGQAIFNKVTGSSIEGTE
jgi:hypothetical protein